MILAPSGSSQGGAEKFFSPVGFQTLPEFLVFRADVWVDLLGEIKRQVESLNQCDDVGEVFHASDAAGHPGGKLQLDEGG